jgi:predicted transcriptional regulator
MNTESNINPFQSVNDQTSLTDLSDRLANACKDCHPLAPITCVAECKTWKLKNEFRRLYEKTKNPDFMTKLLNTIKNKRRLQLLEMVANEHSSSTNIQQRLKRTGFNHSQQTIVQEYINPLIEVGLADQARNVYYATVFGCKLSELIKGFSDIVDILPPHSECYEETVLDILLKGPKTHEDLRRIIPARSVPRILSRLQTATLAETSKERDYIFFFATKRDPNGSKLSPTEQRIHENLPAEGICARKLAEKTGISLRRTYKYLRKLKGKKLVFARKKHTSYSLTAKGVQTAVMLQALRNLAVEVSATTARLIREEETTRSLTGDTGVMDNKRKDENVFPLTPTQPLSRS